MKHMMRLALMLLVLVGLLVGCGQAADDGGDAAPAGDVAFKVTGMVDKEMGMSEADLKAMDTVEADYTNKDGETTTYTGVPVNALLDAAGADDGAGTVTFVAADGYAADVAMDEIRGCDTCIVAFVDGGGLRSVLPDFPGNVQVRDLIEMQVK